MRQTRRFPKYVYGNGAEPDVRFSLANERTFLAWIRTSLALVAVGVALEALDLPVEPRLRMGAAVVFIALGVAVPVHGWIGWARNERAIRRDDPLPGPGFGGLVSVGVLFGSALVLAGVLQQ